MPLMVFAGAEPQMNMPTYGGYNCPGKITEIRCDEDDNGVLQGELVHCD